MNAVKTRPDLVVYGPNGEPTATFADERDKQLFEAAGELLAVCKDILYAWDEYRDTDLKRMVQWVMPDMRVAVTKATGEEIKYPTGA